MRSRRLPNRPAAARRRTDARCRGTILIVTIWIVLVLAGMVVMLARAMRVEAMCSANETSALQAEAIEQGAIQYVLSQVDGLAGAMPTDDETQYQAIRVGNGAFWVIRPNYDDCRGFSYGLVAEASKVNINPNTTSLDMLLPLPDMTDELAACIVDWRSGGNSAPSPGGAKSEYYMLLEDPYQCKEAPLETVEELFLVKGATKEILFGEDTNRNGVLDANEDDGDASDPLDNRDGQLDRGLANFVTVYSSGPAQAAGDGSAGGASGAQTVTRGLIHVSTAPREVLLTLPGLTDSDADAIINARTGSNVDTTTTDWAIQAIPSAKRTTELRNAITPNAYQFSADIVSLSGDGRAFRRCRIVVDNQTSPSHLLYRQDLTRLGWPLDEAIREHVRSGGGVDDLAAGVVAQEKP